MSSRAAIPDDGLDWLRYTFAAVTTILTCARLSVRWRFLKRFEWDDLFHVLAYACFITTTSFQILEIQLKLNSFTLQIQLGYVLLFWSTLWLVKASFLAFCWSIFHPSPTFRKLWWAVAIYTFVTYWPITLMRLWRVGVPSDYDSIAAYDAFQGTSARTRYQITTSAISIALHTSTELCIFALPAVFVSRLQMSRPRKISTIALFAVTFVIIVLGLVRNIFELTTYLGTPLDVNSNFDTILGSFESGAAVIVCALPALSIVLRPSKGAEHERIGNESETKVLRSWKLGRSFGGKRSPVDREIESIDTA